MRIMTHRIASAKAVGNGATVYTDGMKSTNFLGNVSVLITTDAGSVTITQQCSIDGTTYFDPVDKDGNALGAVVAAHTVGSVYVAYAPILAPFTRFKIVEGGVEAAAVTMDVARQID